MPDPPPRNVHALDAANLFLADVRDGLGPYLAIYLIAVRGPERGWNEATVGLVLTIAGIAGLLATTPAGALIDRVRAKRTVLIVAAVLVTIASVSLPFVAGFTLVAVSQSVAAIAGAVFAPGLAAITLGLVGPRAFAKRIGRNEAFNHAGNAVAAAIAGATAWYFGPVAVFYLMATLAALSVLALARIDEGAIDHDVARGCPDGAEVEAAAPGSLLSVLTHTPALGIFAASAFTFHLANAAMLPSVGQLLGREVGAGQATSLMAACIVGAQLVMVPVAVIVGRKADAWGHKPIFLVGFAVLCLRGVLYTLSDTPAWLLGVQLLDGVGAGIFGALFPVVVAAVMRGSGRFNVAQGAVATVQGAGAALSPTIAGTLITWGGYDLAFLVLAAVAALGLVLYAWKMPETALS
ncbi:Predicted arabinose efflux permease, MFS family [Sphingomonas guangdongensis]|uniref:Predicted arabinose efflux permease, MFS family n=1 Tax=Sphingomonas guangdongensis TaxID=1141890 RepID=A0A285R0I5_9SPHN|nr:MFS transporter [Sphingomonas guangdongensis]SOB87344.1 Predicted arabinose efflux permease, MFS family [Sphingomonas guangdongensis]